MIKLQAQFPDNLLKTIELNKAKKFTSQTFTDYCMLVVINVEHPVAHTHTQKSLIESLTKRFQLITRPLLMKTKLSTYALGHAIMHATSLVHIRQQLTTNTPLHNLYLVNNKIFPIYESLVVQFMYQLHLHSALKWVPNKDLGFM